MKANEKRPMPFALGVFCGLISLSLFAQTPGLPNPQGSEISQSAPKLNSTKQLPLQSVLPAEQAFRLVSANIQGSKLTISMKIEASYYLYRDKLSILTADGRPVPLNLPPALTLQDEFVGTSAVYFDKVVLTGTITGGQPMQTAEYVLTYQGCAQDRYCYPPNSRTIKVDRH